MLATARVISISLAFAVAWLGCANPSQAAMVPRDGDLASALLTPKELTTLGLRPVAGPGARFTSTKDDVIIDSNAGGTERSAYRSADAWSPRNGVARIATIEIVYGGPSNDICPADPGSIQRMVSKTECESVRYADGERRPEVVGFATRPQPDVLITASVGNALPGLPIRSWQMPNSKTMLRAARNLARVQITRLQAAHLLRS